VIFPVIFHNIVLNTAAAVSVLGNGLLLVLLLSKTSQVLGNYRLLLSIFALADIFISIFHSWYIPMFLLGEYGYVFFGYGNLFTEPRLGFVANEAYASTFYLPFVLLSLHFIYRYLSISRYLKNPSFVSRGFWVFLVISTIYVVIY
ncbi:hypothetical protein PFISCL1PPCAC_13779, partial [Pristionchus fissidentatus]